MKRIIFISMFIFIAFGVAACSSEPLEPVLIIELESMISEDLDLDADILADFRAEAVQIVNECGGDELLAVDCVEYLNEIEPNLDNIDSLESYALYLADIYNKKINDYDLSVAVVQLALIDAVLEFV